MPTYADDQLAEAMAQPAPNLATLEVEALRAGVAERTRSRPKGPELHAVSDVIAGGVPARLYRPVEGPAALLVFFHGGGWTMGGVDSHDRAMRRLAERSGVAVLSLDYRLAPEHPWPAQVDDAVAALRWIAGSPEELEPQPSAVAIGGDSAGATLATLTCLRVREEAAALLPALQVLIYGSFDLTGDFDSFREDAPGGGMDAEAVRWFQRQWVPEERWGDPEVSPLHAPDLGALPPALVVACELDVLRDGATLLAERLEAAGVEAELRIEPGMVHNFLLMDLVSPACAAAADRIADDLRARLGADGAP